MSDMKIELQRVAPADIEARSMEIIAAGAGGAELARRRRMPVVKRVIHTTADFDYADNLVLFRRMRWQTGVGRRQGGLRHRHRHPDGPVRRQQAGAGASSAAEAVCFMSDPDVAAEAKDAGRDPGHRLHGAGGGAGRAP